MWDGTRSVVDWSEMISCSGNSNRKSRAIPLASFHQNVVFQGLTRLLTIQEQWREFTAENLHGVRSFITPAMACLRTAQIAFVFSGLRAKAIEIVTITPMQV